MDTNVISELMRPTPDAGVVAWVSRLSPAAVCTTAVTLAEVRFGIARLPSGRRRALLDAAAGDVFATFADRVLAFDAVAAGEYADIVVERERAGAPISGFDAQIAAICRAQRKALATRNTSDFDHLGLNLVNPWITGA
ncbi:MAG: PIN domain-containing protein [Acidimicrobiales bacterium]